MFSTSGHVQFIGGYHEYNGGCSIYWRDTRMHVRRYREYTWDVQYIRVFNINQKFLSICSFTCIMISSYVFMVSLSCAEYPPIYSWYLQKESWYPSDVLNIPRSTEHTLYWMIILKIVCLLWNWWLLLAPIFLEVYCECRSLFSTFFSVLNGNYQLSWLHYISKAIEN